MAKTVKVLALPQTYGASLFGLVDMLEAANITAREVWKIDENPFDWEVVTLDGKPVKCSNGLSVHGAQKIATPKAASLNEAYKPEVLILAVPFMPTQRELLNLSTIWREEIAWLRQNHHYFGQIVTHCNGTFILAEAGLLNEEETTTSWWLARHFRQRYPHIKLDVDKRVLQSGRFLLGGATSCYRELVLHFVLQHCGAEIARVLSRYFLIHNNSTSQMLYASDFTNTSNNPVINRAQHWIVRNLEKNFSVTEVAEHAAVTTRTLARHFQKDFGYSPQAHIQKLRIEKSKALLETTKLKLGEIAKRCGYNDESAFRRLFKKHCDVSPIEFRKMFQMI